MMLLFDLSKPNGADFFRSARTSTQYQTFKMSRSRFLAACLSLTLLTALAVAEDAPQPTVVLHPGETAHVVLTFKEPILLRGALVRFSLQTSVPDDQKEFDRIIDGTAPVKLSETSYELDVKVGPHVASGTYVLNLINATNAQDLFRGFLPGKDFTPITICVRNDGRAEFPGLKNVQLTDKDHPKP